MARPLRIQFDGAIYHAMSRGNGRRKIFRDERDYRRFLEGLETTVEKFGMEVFSFGLGHPDSVRGLLNRAEKAIEK